MPQVDKFCQTKFDKEATAKDKLDLVMGEAVDKKYKSLPLVKQGVDKALKLWNKVLYRGARVLSMLGLKKLVRARIVKRGALWLWSYVNSSHCLIFTIHLTCTHNRHVRNQLLTS